MKANEGPERTQERSSPRPSFAHRPASLWRERGLDAGEGRIQARAQSSDHRDDRNGNAGSDQAIFNGGRSGFVREKVLEHVHGASLLLSSPEHMALGLQFI